MPYVGGSLTTFFDDKARGVTKESALRMAVHGGETLEHWVTINTPVETGELRASWHTSAPVPDAVEGSPAFRVTVSTDVDYAPYVEYGTGLFGPKHAPYIIKPKSPQGTLRFVAKDGNVVFAKQVLHPGSPGNHMMGIGSDVTASLLKSGVLMEGELEKWKHGIEGLVH
jgi:hypothetical protein